MIRFKNFIELNEGTYPLWVRFTVVGLVLRVRSLSQKIQTETDTKKQNDLFSQQYTLLSYISRVNRPHFQGELRGKHLQTAFVLS